MDAKLAIIVSFRLQVVIIIILVIVPILILHADHCTEGGHRHQFNILLFDLSIKFPGS